MPYGYLVTVTITAAVTLAALRPPQRPHLLARASYFAGVLVNEVPLVVLAALAVALGDDGLLASAGGWVVLAAAVATALGLVRLQVRATTARPALEAALGRELPDARPWRARLLPWRRRPPAVERIGPLRYGAHRLQRLDLYRRRDLAQPAPVLIHLHGGGYFSGGRRREGRLLRHRLADRGWVVVGADYRLRPAATFPDHLVDAKRVVAWVHEHADELGMDAGTVVMAGSSAGGHLSVLCALTPDDPELQPGFEHVGTRLAGAVSLYAYCGRYYDRGPDEHPISDPNTLPAEPAPPVLLIHGELDNYVPVEGARQLAAHLRAGSSNPVVYAELPGAQHGFDVTASERGDAVVAAVETFLDRDVLARDVLAGARRAPISRGGRPR